jgi:DNA polymerase-4
VVDDLRKEGRGCTRVQLKVRFAPFFTVNRIKKLPEPTFDAEVIAQTAVDLLRKLDDDRPIRLLGVRAEMVPPEGGYDPPRTHGRRGAP